MRSGLVFVLALVLAACEDSAPMTLLDGPRVVAIIADPPVVSTSATAALTLVTALDGLPASPDRVSWRACSPAWPVIDPLRDCVGEPLPTDAEGRALVDVAALAERFGASVPPSGEDPCGRAVIPLTIVVEAELGGARLIARKQIDIGASPPRRGNPVFVQLVGDGAALGSEASAGSQITLSADLATDALDLVCDEGADVPSRAESVRVAVYVGGGAVASDLSFDILDIEGATIAGSVDVTMPDVPASVPLWLVAVDEGGGVAVAHSVLDVRSAR